jgi:dihydropteroate synthase
MPAVSTAPLAWRFAAATVRLDRPVIMGILNITPDSFWDGGRHDSVAAAVRHAVAMHEDGAGIIDIGGESTRPGARAVAAADEIARVVPVVEAVANELPGVPISVDTTKSDVARAALDAGAGIINDVSGLRLDPTLGAVVADRGAGIVLMHSRGSVEQMARYDLANYSSTPALDVADELADAVERALEQGIARTAIVVDPGFGFAKRTEDSLRVLEHINDVAALGYPLLVGLSRKRFIGDVSGGLPPVDRLGGTIAACVYAYMRGAHIFRVHDVLPVRNALDLAYAADHADD